MKALSLRQPWAYLVCLGLKTVEIRTWTTPYRGPLLIHATLEVDEASMRRFRLADLPLGALVGVVDLVEVEPFTADSWNRLAEEHLDPGRFFRGCYAWFFERPRAFAEPLPWRGAQRLFEADADLEAASGLRPPSRQRSLFDE